MASPVTASITVGGSMSPGLNFMAFPLALATLIDLPLPARNPDNKKKKKKKKKGGGGGGGGGEKKKKKKRYCGVRGLSSWI